MKTLTTLLLTLLVLGGCGNDNSNNSIYLFVYPDSSDNYTLQTGFKSFDECRQIAKYIINDKQYINGRYQCGIGCRIEYRENDKNFYICENIQN